MDTDTSCRRPQILGMDLGMSSASIGGEALVNSPEFDVPRCFAPSGR